MTDGPLRDPGDSAARPGPWHVFGAGALGTVIAHRLAAAGVPCTLLSHRRSGTQDLVEGSRRHAVAVTHVDEVRAGGIGRLLLTTKAGQLEAAVQRALPLLAPQAIALTTANGLGFREHFARGGQMLRLHRAVSTAAAYRDRTGAVILAASGTTRVGGATEAPAWFHDSLARLPGWQWDADIDTAIAVKFALNCVINPLTAVRRCRNGALVEEADAAAALVALCEETQTALRALGMWAADDALLPRVQRVCRDTARNRSSMLQDVLAGRKTEIDYLTGELLRRAHRLGMELPRSAALYDAIRDLHPRARPAERG